MKIRSVVLALAAGLMLLVAPVSAGAATTTTATSLTRAPVTGSAHNGKQFSGHFTVTQFVSRSGRTFAVGTLTGKLGSRSIKAKQIALPTSVVTGSSTASRYATTGTVCPVLHLTLGPLNLNLLGLMVHLNQVVLNIDAQSGPGNLLGNLLCGVANLLNTGTAPVGSVSGLLNIVQQLLNNTGLLNL